MKTITLHAPWATLCVTRQPCDCDVTRSEVPLHKMACASLSMVKRFITSTKPCPESIIGQRIAIHAAKRKPEHCSQVGDWMILNQGDGVTRMVNDKTGQWVDLPLGAVVGTATITASLPIVVNFDSISNAYDGPACVEANPASGYLMQIPAWSGALKSDDMTDISGQLLYGDWTPGCYAWAIEDAAPTTERCPWCWGRVHPTGLLRLGERFEGTYGDLMPCEVCGRAGYCDPIPVTGRQGWWNWEAA